MTTARVDAAPLVVDLDGTLTPSDTLHESLLLLAGRSPAQLVCAMWALRKGRAAFKERVSRLATLDATLLPYREELLSYLRQQRREGRRIVLATAAHEAVAHAVAGHLGLFDDVLATSADLNLKGRAKLQAIRRLVGPRFVYAGDSRADLPVWQAASGAIVVGADVRLRAAVERGTPLELTIACKPTALGDWLAAMRVYQWLKNLLLFVPALTAFSILEPKHLLSLGVAFLAFGLAASSNYIVNDLLDLPHDRQHPRKCERAFAAGRIAPMHGAGVAVLGFGLASMLAATLSLPVLGMLWLYLLVAAAYSAALKRRVLIDVIALAGLYTLRIVTGSVVTGIAVSKWLLAFSLFLFLSLALVKRCAELMLATQAGTTAAPGRGYRTEDLSTLWSFGVAAAVAAVVVFGLFASAPETLRRYASPELLWVVAVGLIYWLARLWLVTGRGQMHDDPLLFALRDRASRVTVAIMLVATLAAYFVPMRTG